MNKLPVGLWGTVAGSLFFVGLGWVIMAQGGTVATIIGLVIWIAVAVVLYQFFTNPGGRITSELNGAISSGDVEKVKRLFSEIDRDLDESQRQLFRTAALIAAVELNRKEVVEFIVSKDVDINRMDGRGRTPLGIALENGNEEIADILRGKGADSVLLKYNMDTIRTVLTVQESRLSSIGVQANLSSLFPDREKHARINCCFLAVSYSLLGHMAYVDGFPSKAKTELFASLIEPLKAVWSKSPNWSQLRPLVVALEKLFHFWSFRKGSGNEIESSFASEMDMFCKVFGEDAAITGYLGYLLVAMASADGTPQNGEMRLLRIVVGAFDWLDREYEHFTKTDKDAQEKSPSADQFYKTLQCSVTDSDESIKRKYKRLAKDYHPDMIQGKGLPEDFVKFATKRFQEIQEAYEKILEDRKNNPRSTDGKGDSPKTATNPQASQQQTERPTKQDFPAKNDDQMTKTENSLSEPGELVRQRVKEWLTDAGEAEKQKDWSLAVERYQDILELMPGHPDVPVLLARAKKKLAASQSTDAEKQVASESIKFECSHCDFKGALSKSKIPPGASRLRLTCPKCKQKTVIEVGKPC